MDLPFPAGMLAEIERFLAADSPRSPGQDLYHDLFETRLFFPLQRPAEMRRMVQIARAIRPQVVFEIGADKGASLYTWCKALSPLACLACEIRGLPYWQAFHKAFPGIEFCWLEGSSYDPETVDRVRRWLGRQRIDVLFLDGDKAYYDRDWEAYLPLMAPTGVAFFHDINEPGNPRDAFQRARFGRRWEEIIDTSDAQAVLARQAAGITPRTPHESWLAYWAGRSCGVGVVWVTG